MTDQRHRRSSRLLYEGTTVAAGRFVCPAAHDSWAVENVIGPQAHLVFPRRPVLIRQRGHRAICADRSRVVLYDADQAYEREALHPDGDHADFVSVAGEVVHEVLAAHAVPTADAGSFGTVSVPLDDRVFLLQRRLFRDLEQGITDPLQAEERLLHLVDAVVARPRPSAVVPRAAVQHDLAEAAAALLSADLAAPLRLTDVGRRLHVSPYHLARVFRAHTGSSLHAYREGVRLREAADAATRGSLASLACDLGFSSHSHLTARFRRRFGTTPSQLLAETG